MASRACIDFVLDAFQVAATSVIWLQRPVTKPALSLNCSWGFLCFRKGTQSIQASASGCSPGPRAQNLLVCISQQGLNKQHKKVPAAPHFRYQRANIGPACYVHQSHTKSTRKTFATRQAMGNSREGNLSEIPARSCQYLNQVNFFPARISFDSPCSCDIG